MHDENDPDEQQSKHTKLDTHRYIVQKVDATDGEGAVQWSEPEHGSHQHPCETEEEEPWMEGPWVVSLVKVEEQEEETREGQ